MGGSVCAVTRLAAAARALTEKLLGRKWVKIKVASSPKAPVLASSERSTSSDRWRGLLARLGRARAEIHPPLITGVIVQASPLPLERQKALTLKNTAARNECHVGRDLGTSRVSGAESHRLGGGAGEHRGTDEHIVDFVVCWFFGAAHPDIAEPSDGRSTNEDDIRSR
ncbi:unnamed protein product [Pleuronectes platessa]|uniref:Uncharacterized protein n=1 Tax=Pleuronectes platessa TaxID=8262 RepID=A0A9N7Y1P2_PLEPL|nr:unnamed protein product [Pleuronectes platessa]